jgi:hypothetical protein
MNSKKTRDALIALEIEADCLPDDEQWNLRGADLYEANLRGANLYGADLYGANLREADLREADLRGADLRGADLRGADLRGANLREADLRGANLREADLPYFHKWDITWNTDNLIKIGCKENTVAGWDEWFAGTETYSTARNTEDFERIEAGYQHAKRMVEIWQKYNPEVKE